MPRTKPQWRHLCHRAICHIIGHAPYDVARRWPTGRTICMRCGAYVSIRQP